MLSDVKLKIRHAKRGNEKTLDLSGCGLSDIPVELTQLTMLESVNLENNKLTNLRRIEQLPNLREIKAANNNINALHQEMLDMFSIDTLTLYGNPIVNQAPQLAQVENNQGELKKALQQYFGLSGNQGLSQISGGRQPMSGYSTAVLPGTTGFSSTANSRPLMGGSAVGMNFGAPSQKSATTFGNRQNSSYGSGAGGGTGNSYQVPQGSSNEKPYSSQNIGSNFATPAFLQKQDSGGNTLELQRKISQLEIENKELKSKQNSVQDGDRNWMSSFGSGSQPVGRGQTAYGGGGAGGLGGIERPQTASSQNARLREVQEELKNERKEKRRMADEIESMKSEIQKQNFSAFTQSTNVSVTSGRLPQVPGVREISLEDLELGEKIGQGGFSVIHTGKLNGTPVAIKKIVDPRITDELLQEIQNEIVMQSILRHPNIAMLMGVIPKIPDIYIVFELVKQGSLFDLLHMKKQAVQLSSKERIRIARDIAVVFEYMHHLGLVHRDIKSHNILIDDGLTVKVCDFGLTKFNADIGKGAMQYAGTPTYMAPELFLKRKYDQSVDVFAFGSLLWEIINREVPYDGLDPQDISQKVIKGEKLRDSNIAQIDPRLADLVISSRAVEPSQRPSFLLITEVLDEVLAGMH